MDMLVSMLALSASELAVTEWQKRFASWICGFDTSRLGLGMACWDMDEIGWTRGDFAEQKLFVLQSIDLALQHHRWGVLPLPTDLYDRYDGYLKRVRELVAGYTIEFIQEPPHDNSPWQRNTQTVMRCPEHGVYLHTYAQTAEFSCVIHNLIDR